MGYFHTCPCCGANLDPGERCDCREDENAVPVLQHQDGKAEQTLTGPVSASHDTRNHI